MKSLSQKMELVGRDMIRSSIRGCLEPGRLLGFLESEVQAVLSEALNSLLEREAQEELGRQPYERRWGAVSRNGYKPIRVPGLFGSLTLRRPVVRRGSLHLPLLGVLKRAGQGLVAMLSTRFWLRGTSTRAVAQELNSALGTKLHASDISKLTDALLPEMKAWLERPVPHGIRYLFLDALYLPVRHPDFTDKHALLLALGVDASGHRHVLGFLLGDRESEISWSALIKDLLARGLDPKVLRLVLSDDHKAIRKTVQETLAVPHQICLVHKLRNLKARVHHRNWKAVHEDFKAIFWAESREQALLALGRFQQRWEKVYPKAVDLIVQGARDSMAFFNEPRALWTTLRSTNLIERFIRELRRRFRPAGTLGSENAVLKLFWSVAVEQEKRWAHRKVRGARAIEVSSEAKLAA